jgi:hypothetical protein
MTLRKRPGVGARRKTRQPLKIDKLPQEWRDWIQKQRAKGSTWAEIEEMSATTLPWESEASAKALFSAKRLPETNLIRWYDLRVEQVNREIRSPE